MELLVDLSKEATRAVSKVVKYSKDVAEVWKLREGLKKLIVFFLFFLTLS